MRVDEAKKLINGYINKSSPLKSLQAAYVNTELYNPEVCQGIIHYNINPDTCTFYSDEYDVFIFFLYSDNFKMAF